MTKKLTPAQQRALGTIITDIAYEKENDTLEKVIANMMARNPSNVAFELKMVTENFVKYGEQTRKLAEQSATLVGKEVKSETLEVLARLGYIEILARQNGVETVKLA